MESSNEAELSKNGSDDDSKMSDDDSTKSSTSSKRKLNQMLDGIDVWKEFEEREVLFEEVVCSEEDKKNMKRLDGSVLRATRKKDRFLAQLWVSYKKNKLLDAD